MMQRSSRHALLACVLALALAGEGCKYFRKSSPPSNEPPVKAKALAYGYETYTALQLVEVPTATTARINLLTGVVTAIGEGYPQSMEEAHSKDFLKIAQQTAMRNARAELEAAVMNMQTEGIRDRHDPGRILTVKEAMALDPVFKQKILQALKSAKVVSAKKITWTYRVELAADLTPVFDQIRNFHTRLYANTIMTWIPPVPFKGGDRFPAFRLQDVTTGKTYSLPDILGEATVVVFWLADDFASIDSLSHLEAMYQKFKSRALTVVGIMASGNRDQAAAAIKRRHITFPNLYDVRSEFSKKTGIHIHPYFVLIDRSNDSVSFQTWGNAPNHFEEMPGKENLYSRVADMLKRAHK